MTAVRRATCDELVTVWAAWLTCRAGRAVICMQLHGCPHVWMRAQRLRPYATVPPQHLCVASHVQMPTATTS
jgi:hypothetical protein